MSLFILQAVAITVVSGVMAPGAITAATLADGTRQRHAGALIALGHGIIELPLIALLIAGVGALLNTRGFRISVGLAGGAAMLLLAAMMTASLMKPANGERPQRNAHPLWTGIVLTGTNPYFLLWWATVGLALLTQVSRFGMAALVVFAILHWLADLIWLEILSLASFGGAKIFGPAGQRFITAVCAVAMAAFGVVFVYRAAAQWLMA